jgi:hypothetical protein
VVCLKIKVEWQEGQVWRTVLVGPAFSRNGNWTFKLDGKVFVFKEKRQGETVLMLDSGRWVRAGRVSRSSIFLGEGISSDEYYQTPEGMKDAEKALRSLLTRGPQLYQEHARENSGSKGG